MRHVRTFLACCGVALLSFACGPATPQQTVGPEGGTVTAADGATITVPPGALATRVPVAISVSSSGAPPLPAGVASAGPTYALTPHGTEFLKPVTITLPLTTGAAASPPQVLKTNSQGDWYLVGATATNAPEGERLEAQVSTFSWITTVTDERDVNADGLHRSYYFFGVPYAGNDVVLLHGPPEEPVEGELHEFWDYGALPAEFEDGIADAEVYSSEDGATYWVYAEGPGNDEPERFAGNEVLYVQSQSFRKEQGDATLKFVITAVRLVGKHYGGIDLIPFQCAGSDVCDLSMFAQVSFKALVWAPGPGRPRLHSSTASARLGLTAPQPSNTEPVWDVVTRSSASAPDWSLDNFDFEDTGREAWLELKQPITVEVDLSSVAVGELVTLLFEVEVETMNQVQGETYIAGFLRDPIEIGGAGFEYTGLEPILDLQPLPEEQEAEACTTAIDPAAGTIQFEKSAYDLLEMPFGGEYVVVTREGGSSGDVSVRLRTHEGTARLGEDFYGIDTVVFFADGDDSPRAFEVPLVVDDQIEPLETMTLRLADPRGCVGMGSPDTATISIYDNDTPIDPNEGLYSVGGTVSGLVGSGLTLTGFASQDVTVNANGPFTFPLKWPSGIPYDVRVRLQPTGPAQVCSVTNGSGLIADADVTDVQVTCAPPGSANPYLDPSFGAGGMATAPLGIGEGVSDVLVQPDGKVVVLTEGALTRFTAAGALDSGFGSGGTAPLRFLGTSYDTAYAMALQADGKIVVVGDTRAGGQLDDSMDWAVARYTSSGALDTTFGASGTGVVIGDSGSQPGAPNHETLVDVIVQPDGAIVVGGGAQRFNLGSDFLVMRLTAAGSLDQTFNGDGIGDSVDIGGAADIARAIALQPDGAVVIVGRVAPSGGSDPDIGALRYLADGSLDTDFGDQGVMRDETAGWDEPWDVVALEGGGILVAAHASGSSGAVGTLARYTAAGGIDTAFGTGGRSVAPGLQLVRSVVALDDDRYAAVGLSAGAPDFTIMRFAQDGELDASFGDDGVVTVDFFGAADEATAVTVQADGKVLAAGPVRNGTTNLVGVARVMP